MRPAGEAVLELGVIRSGDSARVGPKLARLGQLASTGWRVPDGYAVTAGALDDWLPAAARAELDRLFTAPVTPGLDDHAHLAWLAEHARGLVEDQPLPAWLEDAVSAAHARLAERTGHGAALRVAVRSSAVAEDGAAASFAGQYATYLGISGIAAVLAHLRKCWASGYSAHALAYRRRFGGAGPLRAHDLAVGVLELVDARSAGVVFTLDPVTGDRERLVVEANWGFGESVVSGQVTPDYWAVDRSSGRIMERRAEAKDVWSVPDARTGVALTPLPADLARAPCLSDDEVRYICRKAAELAESQGTPQDVEWAIARGLDLPDCVFFLQHRPETTWTAPVVSPAVSPVVSPVVSPPAKAFDPVQYALRNVFKVPGT
jgi:pyruvate,water dikinase